MYAADFETTNDHEDCRVWAWGVMDTREGVFESGSEISDFLDFMSTNPGKYAFHNLAFDSAFIIDYIMESGFTHVREGRPGEQEFSTIITKDGKMFGMEICFEEGVRCHIIDSYKIFPMPLAMISDMLGLETKKLGMDYVKPRKRGEPLSAEDEAYLYADVKILCDAMRFWESLGYRKNTVGAQALELFKRSIGRCTFKTYFPELCIEIDKDIRKSYRGGLVFINRDHADKILEGVQVYDVNSLYAWAMKTQPMPYGVPVHFWGDPPTASKRLLWICSVTLNARLKPDGIPCLQSDGGGKYLHTQYVEDTKGDMTFWLTNVDYESICRSYDFLDEPIFNRGYSMRSKIGMFDRYINHFSAAKENAETKGERAFAKRFLVALYGKFGTNPIRTQKWPVRLETGEIGFIQSPPQESEVTYTPIAAFTTAYGRARMLEDAAKMGKKRIAYMDTDSLHIVGSVWSGEIPEDPRALGMYKLEKLAKRAKYIEPKCYLLEDKDGLHPVLSGMQKSLRPYIDFENFEHGTYIHWKPPKWDVFEMYKHQVICEPEDCRIAPKRVKGGIVFEKISFTI
jgi:hypothetical protein